MDALLSHCCCCCCASDVAAVLCGCCCCDVAGLPVAASHIIERSEVACTWATCLPYAEKETEGSTDQFISNNKMQVTKCSTRNEATTRNVEKWKGKNMQTSKESQPLSQSVTQSFTQSVSQLVLQLQLGRFAIGVFGQFFSCIFIIFGNSPRVPEVSFDPALVSQ